MSPRVPENKVMVIYGRKMTPGSRVGFIIITKGGRSPLPIIETYEMLDTGPQNVELDHRDVKVTDGGVDRKASVRVSATVRITDDEYGLKVAAEHLLHVNYRDIGRMAKNFIEARVRTALRTTDFKEASSDLTRTALKVQSMVRQEMKNVGIEVEDLTIHELRLRGG